MITREDLKNISICVNDGYGGPWNGYDLYYKGKKIANYPCSDHIHVVINEENYHKLELDEKIDKELMEFIPKDGLTEDEFNEAKRIWETSRLSLDVTKYIRSIHPEEGSKWAKGYFDLYIDDRDYDKV